MPHRLGPEEMEYTTLPEVLEKLKDRFLKVEGAVRAAEPKVKSELLSRESKE
jgi:fructose 1,6-bisphosphate aldolase/phosphatase